jgi:hypothetical protein
VPEWKWQGAGPMPVRSNDPYGTACPQEPGCTCTFGHIDPMCEVCHPPRRVEQTPPPEKK